MRMDCVFDQAQQVIANPTGQKCHVTFCQSGERSSIVPTAPTSPVCLFSRQKHLYNAGRLRVTEKGKPKLYGGCQLFVDLTQAFDIMPREALHTAFEILQIPNSVSQVLLHWHTCTQYVLTLRVDNNP